MNHYFKYLSLTFLFSLCIHYTPLHAQEDPELIDARKVDSTLASFLKKMDYCRKAKIKHNQDSLYATNQHLCDYIMQHNNQEYMLNYDFKKSKAAGMSIHTSTDSLCRTFLWKVTYTGPIHYRNSMLMFKANTFTSGNLYDKGLVVSDIITLRLKDNTPVYLVHNENEYELQNRYQGYSAHVINDEFFEAKRLFYIGTNAQSNAGYQYDLSSFNKPYVKTQPVTFSKDMQYLYVPIVLKDGVFKGNYLIYQFDGNAYHYIRAGKK